MLSTNNLQSIIHTLNTSNDEREAFQQLNGLKVKELKKLATILTVFVRNMNKQEIIRKIISSTVTARKRNIGIQNRKEA